MTEVARQNAAGKPISGPTPTTWHSIRVSRRQVTWVLLFIAELAVFGLVLAKVVASLPIGGFAPESSNVFYRLYGQHEPWFFLFLLVFTLGVVAYSRGKPLDGPGPSHRRIPQIRALALVTFCVSLAGSRIVMRAFPLAMDEYNVQFQSQIFAAGKAKVEIASEWHGVAPAITPYFVTYHDDDRTWRSAYLPVYSAVRGALLRIHAASLLNPLLAGLTVLALGIVACRLWPTEDLAVGVAALLLASSSQFLFMSMTLYSMPAHLLLNLCWLALYLRSLDARSSRAWLALPWVGVLALGLHNPFPHALFVLPFLWRMMRSGRKIVVAYVCSIYAIGAALWFVWLSGSINRSEGVGLLSSFGMPGAEQLLTQAMSLTLIASWQTPLFVVGLAIALASWRYLRPIERDLAAGILLTCTFYMLFKTSQGHGWGYRYVYNVLGNAVLLAALGIVALAQHYGRQKVVRLMMATTIVSLILQIPLRAVQVREFIAPFANSVAYLKSRPERVLVVHTAASWYGQDLVRNDPFLTPPVIVSASSRRIPQVEWERLRNRAGSTLRTVLPAELEVLGLPTVRRVP